MAGLDDIVQRVLLEGEDDVVESLKRIGEVGEQTFERLEKAAEHGETSFALIAVAIAGLATALSIGATAMIEFVEGYDRAIQKNEALAESFGTTETGIEGLRSAFASVGVSGEVL